MKTNYGWLKSTLIKMMLLIWSIWIMEIYLTWFSRNIWKKIICCLWNSIC